MNEGDGGLEAIVKQQRRDLVAYLTRVRNLPSTTHDLIFMHSEAGVASGLEAASSDRLAEMARNGQTEGLADLLNKLSGAQQEAAVATLARWSESFGLAPERRNAVTVLLAAAATVNELSTETTALVAGAVLSSPGDLPPGALGNVVRLAQRCRPLQRKQLVAKLKQRNDVAGDPSARAALVASFPEFDDADQLYGRAMAMAIGQIDERATKELLTLSETEQAKLLGLADPTIETWINQAREKAENPPEGEEPGDTAAINGWLLPALQTLEGSPAAVTRLAIWLLQAGNSASDTEVQNRLNLLAPVQNPELLQLALTRMQTRSLAERESWLEALDPAAMKADAAAALDAAMRQVWEERIAPDAEPGNFAAALGHFAALAKALPEDKREFPQVEEAIEAASQPPMQDDETAQLRLRISTAAVEFVANDLADKTRCANRFIESAASAMSSLSPGDLDQLPEVRTAVKQLLADWHADAASAALQSLREAATQQPEVQLDATKAEALLSAVGRLGELGEDVPPSLDATAIGELGRDYGERADGALLAWLSYFGHHNLWSALSPMWGIVISPAIRSGFETVAKQLPTTEHQELAEAAFDQSLSAGSPPASNWEAIALRELGGSWVVRALAKRKPEEDLERWRILLEIARQRDLTGKAKTLATTELLRPLATLGASPAFELALDNLGLASKASAEDMLAELELTDDQTRLVEDKLKQLGWKKGAVSKFLSGLVGGGAESGEDPGE